MWRYFELVSDRIIHDDADEAIPDEDVIYQITTFGADFTVDGLVKRFGRGDIFRPEFQRNFVWTDYRFQASFFTGKSRLKNT